MIISESDRLHPDKSQPPGLQRLWYATSYSWRGLKGAWRREAAFRQEVVLVVILTPLAWVVGENALERALLIGSLGLLLITELLNTAIETVTDLITPEPHPLAGLAKDLGSAAVLLALLTTAAVWILIVLSHLTG